MENENNTSAQKESRSERMKRAWAEKKAFIKAMDEGNSLGLLWNKEMAENMNISMSRLAGQLLKLDRSLYTEAKAINSEDPESWVNLAEGLMVQGMLEMARGNNFGLKNMQEVAEFSLAKEFQSAENVYPMLDEKIRQEKTPHEVLVTKVEEQTQPSKWERFTNKLKNYRERFKKLLSKEKYVLEIALAMSVAYLGLVPTPTNTSIQSFESYVTPTPYQVELPTFPKSTPVQKTEQSTSTTTRIIPTKVIPTQPPRITLGIGGDMMLGRHVYIQAKARNDFDPLNDLKPVMGDINLVNLENPVLTECKQQEVEKTLTFCSDERSLLFMQRYNLIVSLANNHQNDFSGLEETQKHLEFAGVPYVFSQTEPADFTTIEQEGVTFGFLSFNLTDPNWGKNEFGQTLKERIEAAKKKVKKYAGKSDWLIVSVHWGWEYYEKPENWQVQFAHELIDSGVNVLVGSHAHVNHDPLIEQWNKGYVIYSAGNLVFDQDWSEATQNSHWFRFEFEQNKINSVEAFPIKMVSPSGQPKLVEP